MNRLGRRHVRRINDLHGRTGTLWEGRFRSCITGREAYVLACHRYIELNPVRAGIVPDPRDDLWSSHRANLCGAPSGILAPQESYLALGPERMSPGKITLDGFKASRLVHVVHEVQEGPQPRRFREPDRG